MKLEYSEALNHLRRWMRENLVTVEDGGVFVRETPYQRSRDLFIEAIDVLGGEIVSSETLPIPGRTKQSYYIIRATVPLELDEIPSSDRYRGGRHAKAEASRLQRVNGRLAGATIDKAKSWAEKKGLTSFWRSLDEAMERMFRDE